MKHCSPNNSFLLSDCNQNKQFNLSKENTFKLMLPVRDIGELNVFVSEKQRFIGKGSGIRFFLLGKQIRHKYNVEDDELSVSNIVGSNLSKFVELPIIKLDNVILFNESSSLRFLSKRLGEYGRNYYIDFIADNIASRCERWRDILSDVFSDLKSGDEDQSDYLKSYKKIRKELYSDFENMLTTWVLDDSCFSIDKENFTFSDFLLYSVILDDIILTEHSDEDCYKLLPDNSIIHNYPYIKKLFELITNLPLVNQWINERIVKSCTETNKNFINSYFSPCSSTSNGYDVGYNIKNNIGMNHSANISPNFHHFPMSIIPKNTSAYRIGHLPINHFNVHSPQRANFHYPVPLPIWGIQMSTKFVPRFYLNNEVSRSLSFVSNK